MPPMTNSSRPKVLITRAEEVVGEDWDDYVRCIERAGGEAVAFDCVTFEGIDVLPEHDGILVTAGIDIDPARYGEQRSERVMDTDPARDEAEAALILHAIESRRPLFCICRGFQLMNVALGGSLLQHLDEREPHRARFAEDGVTIASGWHEVAVRGRTLLERITGQETLRVNSRHHQAVVGHTVAPEHVAASALAPDGVVEAIEMPTHPWALGVQWHPERPEMTADPALRDASVALFEAFVVACQRHATGQRDD